MAEKDNARLRVGVLTSSEHEATLRSWTEGFEGVFEWFVGMENPDIQGLMTNLSIQRTDVIVVDDAALVFEDPNEPDMIEFIKRHNKHGSKVVFIAGPDRTKVDPFLMALISGGATSILATRYLVGQPDAARERLLALMRGPAPSREDARAELDGCPQEKKWKKRLSRTAERERDVLASCQAAPGTAQAEEKMSESEYFEAIRREREAARSKSAPTGSDGQRQGRVRPDAGCGQAGTSGVDDLRRELEGTSTLQPGKTGASPLPSPAAEPAVAEAPAAEDGDRECITFAVAGIRRGAGASHLAHAAAFCIAEEHPELKVCCLMAEAWDFDMMKACRAFREDGEYLVHKRVWFSKTGTGPLPSGFDVVVMDCGVVRTSGTSTFRRRFTEADCRMVVYGGPPWRIADVFNVTSKLKPSEYAEWVWCAYGADPSLVKAAWQKLSADIGRKPKMIAITHYNEYFTPLMECPPQMVRLIESSLAEVMGKKKDKTGGREH